jgi:hypothetical protein
VRKSACFVDEIRGYAVPADLVARRQFGFQGGQHFIISDAGSHVAERTASAGPPFDAESPVHGDEGTSQQIGAVNHDHPTHVRRLFHQSLADSHQLQSPAVVNAELSWAVLAGYFSDIRLHPEPGESGDNDCGGRLKAITDSRLGLGIRKGQ